MFNPMQFSPGVWLLVGVALIIFGLAVGESGGWVAVALIVIGCAVWVSRK